MRSGRKSPGAQERKSDRVKKKMAKEVGEDKVRQNARAGSENRLLMYIYFVAL